MELFSLWKKYAYLILFIFLLLSLLDYRVGVLAVICMLAPIVVSFRRGRFWCGNLCPRGSFYDHVLAKFSRKKKVPSFLKTTAFRVFVVLFMFSLFGLGIAKNWGDLAGIGLFFFRMIILTTLLGIGLAFIYNHRAWCCFCPMGSIAAFIAKLRKNRKALSVSQSCTACKLCSRECPFELAPYQYKNGPLSDPDCLHCTRCSDVCPQQSIGY